MTQRRSRRRRSSSGGPLGGLIALTVGLGAIVVIALVAKSTLESRAATVNQPPPKPAAPDPTPRAAADPTPVADRPAPELDGDVIIRADAVFREARSLHRQSLEAEKAGDGPVYKQVVDDCYEEFDRLDTLLQDYVRWHEEAQEKGWPVPRAYDTLVKRRKRYGELRAKLPAR